MPQPPVILPTDVEDPAMLPLKDLKTGLFGGSGDLSFSRFTGPGRVGIRSACVHLPTEN